MERQPKPHRLQAKMIFFIIVLAFAWIFFTYKNNKLSRITDFDSCVAAGYRVLETYPEQCVTQDGRIFVRVIDNRNINSSPVPNTNGQVEGCVDRCGDNICQEVVCLAIGCPCAETPVTCPQDCSITKGTIRGTVTIGPNCPVERDNVPCPANPEAYTSRSIAILDVSGKQIAQTHFDAQGKYSFSVPAGTYTVALTKNGIETSKEFPATVTVKAQETATVDGSIDTGIR